MEQIDELNALKCYETFAGGDYVAFGRQGEFYFGPVAKLSALFSGSNESFLVGKQAEAQVARLRAGQPLTEATEDIAEITQHEADDATFQDFSIEADYPEADNVPPQEARLTKSTEKRQ